MLENVAKNAKCVADEDVVVNGVGLADGRIVVEAVGRKSENLRQSPSSALAKLVGRFVHNVVKNHLFGETVRILPVKLSSVTLGLLKSPQPS